MQTASPSAPRWDGPAHSRCSAAGAIRVWGTSSSRTAPTRSPASEYSPSPCASSPTRKQTGLRLKWGTVQPWTRRPSHWDSSTAAASCSGHRRHLQPLPGQ